MRYIVRCEDGQVRHRDPYTQHADAEHFAEWGHVCTSTHAIEGWDEERMRKTTELRPGDAIDGDVVTRVELPQAPAVVAVVHVERNGKAEWFGSGVEAWHVLDA